MAKPARRGTLVLVVGPSGAGKDTLIDYCRARLADGEVVFARRVVTRAAGAGEDHDTLDPAAFAAVAAEGGFALEWQAHGLRYGVPASIRSALAAGCPVVVNVSRGVVDAARQRFQPLAVVLVTAPADILARRLGGRGREDAEGIAGRLARPAPEPGGADVTRIENSGTVETAGEALLALLTALPCPARLAR